MKTVLTVPGLASVLLFAAPALGQTPSVATALGGAAQARVSAPAAPATVKPGAGGGPSASTEPAQSPGGSPAGKAAALAKAIEEGDPHAAIVAGGSAQDITKIFCARPLGPCPKEGVDNGPGPGQTTPVHPLDFSTARFVGRDGQFWSAGVNNGTPYRYTYVQLKDTGGNYRYIMVGEYPSRNFAIAAPWITPGGLTPTPDAAPR